ncbi:unnamed protein product [Penicillium nalgiovense]|nr:unnamed protein product [Penicillium nalgiovense]CAG8099622.1 unnamed protein product [Penicillium nalgiovense]
MISLALALVGVLRPVGSLATDPGPAACSKITSQLGSSKVVISKTSLKYVASTEYWSTPQDTYKPSCVIYPSSSEDVFVTIQAIRASGSWFAVKRRRPQP